MNNLVEYDVDLPPTDLAMTPKQNRAVFGERFVEWLPDLPLNFKWWEWN